MIDIIKRHSFVFFGINILCVISSVICIIANNFEGYALLAILPLVYGIVFNIIFFPLIYVKKSYTVIIFSACCFLRCVLLPVLQSLYPVYGFSSFSTMDTGILQKSILLMAYELIVCSVFLMIFFLVKKDKQGINKTKDRKIYFKDGKSVIICFVTISLITLVVFPQSLKSINFFIMQSGTGTRISSSENSTLDMLLRQIFIIGQLSLYVLVINRMKNRYEKLQKNKYIVISLLFTIINLGIIVGEQRSVQVYFAFASVYLIGLSFPKYKNKLTKIIVFAAIMVLVLMTIYKQFYAFRYDSYIDALSHNSIDMFEVTRTAEIYLLGPQSVAAGILLGNDTSLFSMGRLIYDFMRSFIGLSFLVKDIDMLTTSNLFNLFVTNGRMISSYLLPITAQGYLYFGLILSPVLMIGFLKVSLYLEKVFLNSQSIYVTFFAAYAFIRSATCIVSANINSVITAISLIIMSAGLVYLGQWIIGKLTRQKVRNRYGV